MKFPVRFGDNLQQGGKKMIEIGRICFKIAGRDSNKKCVIVDVLEPGIVLIDGETRRRKCNIKHLELMDKKINIEKGADTKTVIDVFKKELGIEIKEKKAKTVYTKPLKKRILKTQAQMEKKKKIKTTEKKEETKKKEIKKEEKKTVKKETKTEEKKIEEKPIEKKEN